MDIEKIIDEAKADVESAIRKVVPAVEEGAKIAADVRSLDVSALMADIEDVVHGHLSAAGIVDAPAGTAPAKTETTTTPTTEAADPEGITREPAGGVAGGPPATTIPPEVAAGLADETSAEPSGVATEPAADVAGSMGAEAVPGDPEGITRATPGPQ